MRVDIIADRQDDVLARRIETLRREVRFAPITQANDQELSAGQMHGDTGDIAVDGLFGKHSTKQPLGCGLTLRVQAYLHVPRSQVPEEFTETGQWQLLGEALNPEPRNLEFVSGNCLRRRNQRTAASEADHLSRPYRRALLYARGTGADIPDPNSVVSSRYGYRLGAGALEGMNRKRELQAY